MQSVWLKQSKERLFINKIRACVVLFYDTQHDLDVANEKFTEHFQDRLKPAESAKPDAGESADGKGKGKKKPGRPRKNKPVEPAPAEAAPAGADSDEAAAAPDEFDKSKVPSDINKIFKKVSLRCHPDKTTNSEHVGYYNELNKLIMGYRFLEFLCLVDHIQDRIDIEIDFNIDQAVFRSAITDMLSTVMAMRTTFGWLWYYGTDADREMVTAAVLDKAANGSNRTSTASADTGTGFDWPESAPEVEPDLDDIVLDEFDMLEYRRTHIMTRLNEIPS